MSKPLSEYINDEVKRIGECSSDPEAAHSYEDDLRELVLVKISEGDFGLASEWAKLVLQTNKYDFPRWCA